MGAVANMYAAVAGSSAWVNAATFDPPLRGTIDGIMLAWSDDSDADADTVAVNISFSATPGLPVSGDYSSMLYVSKNFQLVTSGAANGSAAQYCIMPQIPIAPGQRVYMHALATTGITASINCGLHLSFNVPR